MNPYPQPNDPCGISGHCIKIPFSELKLGSVIEVHGHHFTVYQKTDVNGHAVQGTFHAQGNAKALHRVDVNRFVNICEFKDMTFHVVRRSAVASRSLVYVEEADAEQCQ